MNKSALMIVCGVVGAAGMWLATYAPPAQAQVQSVMDINRLPPARYEVRPVALDKGWVVFKLDRVTGQSWRLDGTKWSAMGDTTAVMQGNYEMQTMPLEHNGCLCIRLETNNGRVWTTDNDQWTEIK